MAQAERYAWLSLVAWIAILLFLWMRFTTGVEILGQSIGLTIVEQSAGQLFGTYVSLTVFAIIAESIIAGSTAAAAALQGVVKDERDHAIESRANLAAYWFMAASVNVIVIQVLAGAAFGGRMIPQLSLTSFTTMTGISFALMVALVGAEIVKRIALIWNYRAS
jgi:hypothetical protein